VAAVLIHQNKVLLVKHKKLGMWLSPGGHIEADELPHAAAEREFWEETGIKVKAIPVPEIADPDSEYLPNPISTNLHWVSRPNFDARTADPKNYTVASKWKRGCEQHLNFLYLVKPVDSVEFVQNLEETDGIEWFDLSKIDSYNLAPNIKTDLLIAQKAAQNL
jgi:8-oxo-dGTP pyrophosphatase MutT (NUDIX family)